MTVELSLPPFKYIVFKRIAFAVLALSTAVTLVAIGALLISPVGLFLAPLTGSIAALLLSLHITLPGFACPVITGCIAVVSALTIFILNRKITKSINHRSC